MDEDTEKEKKESQEDKKEEKKEKKGGNKLLLILGVLVILLIGLSLLGRILWAKIAGRILGRLIGGAVNVQQQGGKVTVSGSQGNFSFQQGGSLPQGFPSDFPVYPGAKLTGSWTAQGDKGQGISVVWETQDSVSQVTNFYKSQLDSAGWKETSNFATNDSSTISFEKGNVSGFMGITKADNKTTISVTVGTK